MSGFSRGRGAYYKAKYGGGRGGGRGGGHHAAPVDDFRGEPARSNMDPSPSPSTSNPGPYASSDLGGQELRLALARIDGRQYPAYKDLKGPCWPFAHFQLRFHRVQGDAYAPPTSCSLLVPAATAAFPEWSFGPSKSRRVALADFLTRAFIQAAAAQGADKKQFSGGGGWSSAKGGDLRMEAPGQCILERTSVAVAPRGDIEARFTVALPAQGRTILGAAAAHVLCDALPLVVARSLLAGSLDLAAVRRHVGVAEDHAALQGQLAARGLLAFVADGSLLARASGASDLPMGGAHHSPQQPSSSAFASSSTSTANSTIAAVPFVSPPEHRVEFVLPNAGVVRGMGLPAGVTVIVGGGFHGKSTLLHALERGVYPKVPGDGRELVCTVDNAIKVRAEDGRSIAGVDISPFIGTLPFGRPTSDFSTPDASGSTSMAANILEAIESGARTLLIDEDTAATNFMIRDARMRALVPSGAKEPITPLIARVRQLYTQQGVSSVIVMGGSGDYFEVADQVILMDCYRPSDVTADARRIVSEFSAREAEAYSVEGKARKVRPVEAPSEVHPQGSAYTHLGGAMNRTHGGDAATSRSTHGQSAHTPAPGQTPVALGSMTTSLTRGVEEPATPLVVTERVPLSSATLASFPSERTRVSEVDAIWYGGQQNSNPGGQGSEAGPSEINLKGLEQLVEKGQTRFIAEAIKLLVRSGTVNGRRSVRELMEWLNGRLEYAGMDCIAGGDGGGGQGGDGYHVAGDYARPRMLEVAGALNRLRGLQVRQKR
eukprot:jgi/Mesvir1/5149/Mv15292-RA.2